MGEASSVYKHMAEMWRKPEESGLVELQRERSIKWRRGRAIVRVERPLRLNRARALGYRAKQGFVMVRVRIGHGGLRKLRPRMGRRPKKMGVSRFTPAQSLKVIAQARVAKKYPNLKVLNSYWVWEDGRYHWYETILVDPNHPAAKNDPSLNSIGSTAN